ncbi:MAG TPA: hypothetical protein VF980_04305 [Thermoanaerobaculia bacterium]
MRAHVAIAAGFLLVAGCGAAPDQRDHQAEWRDVLRHKKAAASPQATPVARQMYADALSSFVQRHPGHSRAREVYRRVQLEFANELASLDRCQDAIRVYRAVLTADPKNDEAKRGLEAAASRLAVSRQQLLSIDIGMTQKDVARILGKPIPGWTATTDRASTTIEAWYYRTTTGAIAAIYFRDGEVFAAEEQSQARVGL